MSHFAFALPVPSPRRQRCLSCSDNTLDLTLDTLDNSNIPEVIVTKRTRTVSMCGRIVDEEEEGTVKYFCRSRGHGIINPDDVSIVRILISTIKFNLSPIQTT